MILIQFIEFQIGYDLQSITLTFGSQSIFLLIASFVYTRFIDKKSDWFAFFNVISLLLFAVGFALLGPIFPLSTIMSLSLYMAVASEIMIGMGAGMLHAGSFVAGLSELREMGVEDDPAFATAFSASFLSSVTLG